MASYIDINPTPTESRQPNSDRLKDLYEILKDNGANVGTSGQFRDWMMKSEDNRRQVYEVFKDNGANVGEQFSDFDTWLYDMSGQPTYNTQTGQSGVRQQPTQRKTRYDVAQEQYEQGRQQTNATPISQTAMGSVGGYGISPMGMPVRNTQGYPQANPQPQAPAKPMSPAPRAGQWSGAPMQQTPYAPTEEKGNKSFMPIEQGEDTKARYDAQRNAVGGQGGQVENMRSDIDSRLQEAYQRDLDNYGSELDKGGFWARMGRSVQAAEGNNPAANAVPSQLSDDTRDYQAAKHALDNSQKMIDEANAANRNGNFFAGAGRGMRDKFFDVSTWDFGITDLTDQAAIMRALEAYDKGEQLTESQQALLDAKAVELATTAYFGSELGRGYKAGQVTAEAIPFMFEMAINPAAGVGKGASKAMVRYALKKFGKEAIEKGGKRYIAKQAMKYGTRIVGDVIGASGMTATTGAARTAADALDRMAGNIHYGTDEQGNITFDGHTDAESVVKAFGKAFASTTIENYSEMLGNYFGPALGLLGKGASKVGKGIARTKAGAAVGRGIDKIGGAIETAYNSTLSKKIGLQAVGDFISKVPAGKVAGFLSELEKRAQWHGVMGEYAEEVAGGILNALVVGDQTLDTDKDTGVFNLDNNIDTFLGVALMGGFFSGAKTVGYGVERAHNARQFNKANRMGAAAFGDGWANVQAAIESDPKAGVVAVLADPNSSKEQREAALRYAAAVTARQGMEQGKAKRDAEGVQTPQEAAAEQSYNTGYDDATTDELRSDINMAYTDARQKLVELIGEDAVNDIDSDPLAMQAQYDQDMTVDDNTKYAIADYVSAKSAWDGVQQRISDDAADRADQRRAEGERMAYKGNGDMQGAIRPLTINEESKEIDPETGKRIKKTVYLVNGTIAIEPNGNGLSREGTDKTIYVYDPETGEAHELDPFGGAGVLEVGDVVSMDDYLAQNEQQSQAEVQQEIDNATGKVNVQPNTPFVTPEGRQGIVKSVEGDNVIVQFADGEMEEASIPLAEVQQYADALRRQEYEARHPQTPAKQPQRPITATEGQAPTAEQTTPQKGNNADTRTPAQRTYDDVVAKLGADRASKKIDATAKVKADRLTKAQKALRTAQETADNTEYGSKEEQKAEEAVVKAQEEYDNALADFNAWDEVRKLRDQALLAKAEQEEQQRKAERERRLAEETEAQRKQREAYEAEQARRKAEAEAAEKRRQEENERLRRQAANPQPAEQPAPIEGTKGQASQLEIARQELADDPEALAMLDETEPRTLVEVAATLLASGKNQVRLIKDDFMRETGYTPEDVKRYPFVFATADKGGITLSRFGEMVAAEARNNGIPFDENDPMAGVTAALNMLGGVGSQGDINNYITNSRIAEAYDYHNAALAAARANMLEAYGMTEGEYEAYMSWLEDAIEQGKSTLSDEEFNQIFNVYEQGQTTNAAGGNQEGAETTERTESAETDVSQNGERGNREADAGEQPQQPAVSTAQAIAAAEAETDTNPTEGQKESGNYKKGHVCIDGYDITIEQPKGSVRRGTDKNGRAWEQEMHNTYGYIRGTESVDGDHIDVFLSDDPTQGNVYVVDQVNEDGTFDEHKVMYGFPDMESARQAYLSNYEDGWRGLGTITPVSKEEFKKWIESSHRKTKPFSEYKGVKTEGDVMVGEGIKPAAGQTEETAEGEKGLVYDTELEEGVYQTNINQLREVAKTGIPSVKKIEKAIRDTRNQLKDVETSLLMASDDAFVSNQLRKQAMLNGKLRALKDFLAEVKQRLKESEKETTEQTPKQESNEPKEPKRLISDEQMDELKERLRKKLRGQLNSGIDPETLSIGLQLAVGHVERGLTKFADFAKRMIEDLGDAIRPYLKSFYNGARDFPGAEKLAEQMTPYDEVRAFDVENFDKSRPSSLVDYAKEIAAEQEVEKQVEQIKKPTKGNKKEDSTLSNTEQGQLDLFGKTETPNSNENNTDTDRTGESAGTEAEPTRLGENETRPNGGLRQGYAENEPDGGNVGGQPNADGGTDEGAESRPTAAGVSGNGGERDTATEPNSSVQSRPVQVIKDPQVEQGDVRTDNHSPLTPKEKNTPKNTRNYLYPADAGEIDNYTPSERMKTNLAALEVLRTLIRENREATPEERATMGKLRGWGGVHVPNAYSAEYRPWELQADQRKLVEILKELDPNGELKLLDSLRTAAHTSYYTPIAIAKAMHGIAELAGYKGGGSMLDPSMGNGVFEGTMKKGIQQSTQIRGVELDWLTGQIARRIYPDAKISITGVQDAHIPENRYDYVVSNIPFGNLKIVDLDWEQNLTPIRKAASNRIHNYFAVKMIESTRKGGVCVIMTSNAIMDTNGNAQIREYIADNCEILGCIRLPNNTFKGAGTRVVTDVIVLRKFKDETDRINVRNNAEYANRVMNPFRNNYIAQLKDDNGIVHEVTTSGYYNINKKNVIGEPKAGGQYSDDAYDLSSDLTTEQIAEQISKIGKRFMEKRKEWFGAIVYDTTTPKTEITEAVSVEYKGNGRYESAGNIVVQDGNTGKLQYVKEGNSKKLVFTAQQFSGATNAQVSAYTELRTLLKELITYQIEGNSEEIISGKRAEMQQAYKAYTDKYGQLQSKKNNFIEDDIDGFQVRALEKWKNGKFVGMADIFTKNTIKGVENIENERDPQKAVLNSLSMWGKINTDYLQRVLGDKWFESCKGMVFEDPSNEGTYVPRDIYLTGDVVSKLEYAKLRAAEEKKWQENVDELEKVQPRKKEFGEFPCHLGARWVPVEIYNDFLTELFDVRSYRRKSGIVYNEANCEYVFNLKDEEFGGKAAEYRTNKKSASEIFEAALLDRDIVIYNRDDDGKVIGVNKEATEAARDKVQMVRDAFEDWVVGSQERVKKLTDTYNSIFNRFVLPTYNGQHLNVVGLQGITLRPHQKDAIWRIINQRGGIIDHIVGAGKSLVMMSSIMEMRRMGVAKKPMIVALKATTAQIAKEFREAFPTARVLAPDEKDFSVKNRKKFLAQIAVNDYDCIILSHEQYSGLDHSDDVKREFIEDQINQLDNLIEYLYGQEDITQLTKKQIKGLEKRRANLQEKLKKLELIKTDEEFVFENLGVDYLFVDECQAFKNLMFQTSYGRVAGLGNPEGSERSTKLLYGIRSLQKLHQGDMGTVFLSGTTISNSLSELYNIFNYLRPNEMRRMGLNTFDAWASTFAVRSIEAEFGVTNELKEKSRFRKFEGLQELSRLYTEIADVRNDSNLELPKPKTETHFVAIPISDTMQMINDQIVNLVNSHNGEFFGIYPENIDKYPWSLAATNLAKKATLTPKLISTDFDDENGKIFHVCENVAKIYKKFDAQKGVQLIFCDAGVPDSKKEYDAYTDIINRLTEQYGIPREEIVDIHEANNADKRQELFARVNNGEVRILIGGTKNMGTGVNVQKRVVAMHHLDIPWTPADVAQRNGRGARQGNEIARDYNDNKVDTYYYAVEQTLDTYRYQLQDVKGKMIDNFKTANVGLDEFDEGGDAGEDGGAMNPAEMVAILSGNPIILDKAKQDKIVEKLNRLKRSSVMEYARRKEDYAYKMSRKKAVEELIKNNAKDIERLRRNGFAPNEKGEFPPLHVTIDGKEYEKATEAGKAIYDAIKKNGKVSISAYGMQAKLYNYESATAYKREIVRELVLDTYSDIPYRVQLSENETAAGQAMQNLLKKVYSAADVYARDLETINHQLEGAEVGEYVFAKQAELDAAIKRKREIDDEYNKLIKKDKEQQPKADPSTDSDVRFRGEEEPVFYSNAMRAVENIKQERATPEQWVKMIEKQGGMKAGEDKWLGLSEWLKGSDAKTLTKGEVLDYIRANEIQVEEVEYGEGNNKYETIADELRGSWNELYDEAYSKVKEKYEVEDESEIEWDWINDEIIGILEERYGADILNHISYDEDGSFEAIDNPINEIRLSYTTEGLDNKREIVLTVPTIEPWNEHDEVHFGEAGGGRAVAWVRFGETTVLKKEAQERYDAAQAAWDDFGNRMYDKYGANYINMLDEADQAENSRLREEYNAAKSGLKDPANQDRVLVIDEIQSNRHQEGREKGYTNKGVIEEYNHRGDMLTKWRKRFIDKYNIEPWKSDEDIIKQLDEYEKEDFINIKRKYEEARDKYQALGSVPDAPFEKNWHEVAMKRMLRFAAENGYDKVAWTKGEQQAERYDLGEVVDFLYIDQYSKDEPRFVNVRTVYGSPFNVYFDNDGVVVKSEKEEFVGKNLADIFGKELANKIVKSENGTNFAGDDLRIGGEGMKGFYDQILPRFMDKYGKKWGVKTGEVELPNIGDNGLTMWSVDVTDDMRESVMRGQPLFRPKTQSREGGEEAYAGEWYDRNSVERIGEFAGYTPKRIAAMNARQEQTARNKFRDAAEKLHLGENITFADSIDDVPGLTDKQRREWRRKKGWYSPRTGKIVIILGNHKSMDDVMKSILHEGVAHHGLRQMFGKHFDTFLDNVYQTASPEIRDKINEMAKKHGWDFREATEEYLAMLAEDTDFERPENQSWWKQVKEWFIDLLHKIGFKLHDAYDTITDNELRYILWRSYENLVNPGRYNSVVEEAKDIAKQYELKVGRWDVEWTIEDREPNATTVYNGRIIPIWATNGRRGNRADRVERADRVGSDYNVAADGVAEDAAEYAQRDAEYMEAVNSGDMEKAQRMVNEAAKRAMPDTKVVDENGNPLVVYHGGKGKIIVFDKNRIGENLDYGTMGAGFYFTSDRENAENYARNAKGEEEPSVERVFINIRNIKEVNWNELDGNSKKKSEAFTAKAIAQGYDGLMAYAPNRAWWYVAFDPEQIKSADPVTYDDSGNVIPLSQRFNEGSDDIRFRDGEDNKYAPKAQAAGLYERAMNDGWNQFTEAMQDSMMSVKKLVMSVLEARGEKGKKMRIEDVAGYENPWLAENRLRGSIKNQVFAWQRDYMEPLQKAIYDITGGIKPAYDELMDYMMAKHGLERNEVLAKRDAKKAWEEQNKSEIGNPNYTAAKNAAFANIDAGVDDLYLEQRKKDYAGLTALTGKEDVEEAEKEAQRMVDEFEKRFDTTKLWEATNRATRSSLFTMLECGMMTPARHSEIRDMFKYYIPLQGFDSDVAEDVYAYMGSDGTRLYGTAIRAAKGRKSKADDPIATIAMNGEAAIRRGNRNLMKQHFLRFVQAHPSDLVSVSDVWLRKNVNGEWEQYFDADLKETDTPEEVADKVRDFNERMEQEAASNPDLYKRSRDLPNVPFRVLNTRDMKQHQVMVQVNGKNYLLTVNGNPRAAQALNGLSNPDVFTESVFGKAMNIAQSVTRELSQFYTTRKPSFVLSNFSRDSIYTNLIVGVKEDKKYSRAFHKNWVNMNPATMGKLFNEWVNGELRDKILAGTATDTERMFNDFLMYGGETGWISMRDIERQKKDLQKALKQEGNTAAQKWKSFWATVDLANRAVENCARFAAFMTSQQMGRSIERSVWDAKEISVNFEKKGAGDKFLGSKNQTVGGWIGAVIGGWCRGNYAFWNAGVQGISNFYRAAKKKPGKFALRIFAMNFTLGMIAPLISALLGGDDDDENSYFNLPEYKRRNNLCFRFTKHMPWITIPLPIEFRAIYGLGELAMCHMLGKEHFYNGWDCAKAYMQQLSQVLPLDFLEGGGKWHVLLPTYAKPAVEAYANEGWTGLPIYKENTYGQYKNLPEWQRAYPNTNMLLVNGTRWINEATVRGDLYTGGNNEDVKGFINWNPARIEYMLRGYLGGYYSMYEHSAKTISTIAGKREFEWRNIPLAHVLITEGDERTAERSIKNEYYKIVDDYENTDHKLSQYDEKAHTEKENEERRQKLNTDKRYLRHEIVDIYKTLIDKLNDTKKNADEEEKKAIEEYQAGLRKEMVDMVHNLESKSKSELEKGDNLGQIDELAEQALGSRYESGDLSVRKAIGSITAKRIGERYGSQASDNYGSGSALDTEYGKIYEKHRTYTDMAGDIMLNEEIKRARAEKDYARLDALEGAKKDIADNRDDLNQFMTQEGIDNIMEVIRKIRRKALYPEQAANPTDNVEE